MGRGLLYCHIYASERTPLGTGGVGSGTEGNKGGSLVTSQWLWFRSLSLLMS